MAKKKANNKKGKQPMEPAGSGELVHKEPAKSGEAVHKEPAKSGEAVHDDQPGEHEATVTSTESAKKRLGAARGVSALHKVLVKKAQGKKIKIRYNELGEPIGDTRATLQSYIGMVARNMIPIDIPSWPEVDTELKEKLWLDVQVKFKHLFNSILVL